MKNLSNNLKKKKLNNQKKNDNGVSMIGYRLVMIINIQIFVQESVVGGKKN